MPRRLPSTRTSSPSLTRVPSTASVPLHVTRPASIHLSASRREHTPVSLMYLLSLMEVLAGRSLGLRREESGDLLRQSLGSGLEQVCSIFGKIDEFRFGQGSPGPLRVIADPKFDSQDQTILGYDGQPLNGGHRDQYQAPHQVGSCSCQFESDARSETEPQKVNLTQAQLSRQVVDCLRSIRVAHAWRRIRLAAAGEIRRVNGPIVGDLRQKTLERSTRSLAGM